MLWLAGDVKEPTRLSQRVGHEVPGVVVWPLLLRWLDSLKNDDIHQKHEVFENIIFKALEHL